MKSSVSGAGTLRESGIFGKIPPRSIFSGPDRSAIRPSSLGHRKARFSMTLTSSGR
jgi:hypothetical protein